MPSAIAVRRFSGSEMRPSRRSGRHPYAVVAYQVSGVATAEHGGRLELHPGDVHLIPAGQAHRGAWTADAQMWCVALRTAELDRERFGPLLGPLDDVVRGALPRITIPETRRDFVCSLFAELAALDGRAPAIRAESLVALLLAEIGDHAPAPMALPSRASDVVSRALAFIGTHALSPLSLEAVARGIGHNRSHVAELVRRETGRSVGDWIAEVRLDEARRRLEATDELIEVIAERVGYGDATHFARTFKRRFGVTPRAWRGRFLAPPRAHGR